LNCDEGTDSYASVGSRLEPGVRGRLGGRALDDYASIPKSEEFAGLILNNEACLLALASAAAANDAAHDLAQRAGLEVTYAVKALTALAEAERAGSFKDPGELANMKTDPDLHRLHGRADSQRWFMDMIFPADPFAAGR
jgi:hypothetical protein